MNHARKQFGPLNMRAHFQLTEESRGPTCYARGSGVALAAGVASHVWGQLACAETRLATLLRTSLR